MTLSKSTLADELASMAPTGNVSTATNRFATAFNNYFKGAQVNGVPAVPAALNVCKDAMVSAMGVTLNSDGATAIQSGINAYWVTLSIPANAILIWPQIPPVTPIVSITPPPSLGSIGGQLTPVFLSNTASSATLKASASAIAAVIDNNHNGGVAVFTPPPPASAPIL